MRRILLTIALAANLQLQAAEVQITNSTVRQPLPGRTVSAGYFTIHNSGSEAVSLVAATSPWFGKVELHQHSYIDGMMRMERVERIEIAPRQTVHLQPGGLHLMLFSPNQQLQLDQQVPIEVELDNGQKLAVMAVVTKIPKQ